MVVLFVASKCFNHAPLQCLKLYLRFSYVLDALSLRSDALNCDGCSWRTRPTCGELHPPWAREKAAAALRVFELCYQDLVVQLAEALVYLHGQGFSHNDLHEGNVLLTLHETEGQSHARVGICDWGRACHEDSKTRLGLEGKIRRNYIAPEHILPPGGKNSGAKGSPCAASSDVYSFGYLMALVMRNRESPPPPHWVTIAASCQERDRRKRPSMANVLARLKAST